MSVSVTFNGVTYTIPQTGDTNWGDSVTSWVQAISSAALSKAGGSFVLTAELDFGGSFGLKALYYKSRTTAPAQSGQVRLAFADTIKFRNTLDTADLALSPTAVDSIPSWNAINLVNVSTAQTLTTKTIDAASNTITNLDNATISASAAIALTKLAALTASRLLVSNASGVVVPSAVTDVEAGYLSGVTSGIQSQINTKEGTVTAGNSTQYYRGDKTFQTLDKAAVGLSSVDNTSDATKNAAIATLTNKTLTSPVINTPTGIVKGDVGLSNVDNTSDANKPVSTSSQTALDLKAPLANPALTGTPTSPTAVAGTSTTQISTTAFTTGAVATHAALTATHGVSGALVGTTDAQVLTNKDIDGGTSTNTRRITLPSAAKTALDALTRKAGTIHYASDLSTVYIDTGAALTAIGASTGSGITNFITSSDGSSTTGWAGYKDAAAVSPVDGTGGVSDLTLTSASGSELTGTTRFALAKPALNSQGSGFGFSFNIDNVWQSKPLTISLQLLTDANYVDDDFSIWIYDVANFQLIQPTPYKIKKSTSAQVFKAEFQANSGSSAYRLIVHCATASTTAQTLIMDQVIVTPNTYSTGASMTDPVSYTPIFSAGFGTVSAVDMKSRREGAFLVVEGNFTIGTVSAVAGTMTLGYNGVNGNVTSAAQTPTYRQVGNYALSGANARHGGFILATANSTTVNIADGYGFSGTIADAFVPSTVSNWAVPGQIVSLSARIPITGWGTSQVLSSETDTRIVSSRAVLTVGQSVAASATNTIIFNSISSTYGGYDKTGSYNVATGEYTVGTSGLIQVEGVIVLSSSSIFNFTLYKNGTGIMRLGGTFSGTGTTPLSGKIDVIAGDILTVRATNGTAGAMSVYGSTSFDQSWASFTRVSGPAQVAASEKIKAKYKVAASHTASTTAPVQFNTKIYDSHGAVTTGASWKFTAPRADNYRVSVVSIFGTGAPSVAVYKNGAVDSFIGPSNATSLNSGYTEIDLLAGDYIDIRPDSALTAASDNFRITVSAN